MLFQTDPFQVKSLVVQNDVLEFVVTLQNPYIFDLELQELSLRSNFWMLPIIVVHILLQYIWCWTRDWAHSGCNPGQQSPSGHSFWESCSVRNASHTWMLRHCPWRNVAWIRSTSIHSWRRAATRAEAAFHYIWKWALKICRSWSLSLDSWTETQKYAFKGTRSGTVIPVPRMQGRTRATASSDTADVCDTWRINVVRWWKVRRSRTLSQLAICLQ